MRINADLLRAARELGVDLSKELERRFEEIVAAAERERWLVDNREAIQAYNEHIESRGAFSDGVRGF